MTAAPSEDPRHGRPNPVADRPAIDVLSDVLRAVRLTGAVYFDFDLGEPWVLVAPASREVAGRVMPGAGRVIQCHLMATGSGWASMSGEAPFALAQGDLVVFPQGDAHVLSSAPGLSDAPDSSRFDEPLTPLPRVYRVGGAGAPARVVCCFLGCDEYPFNPLLSALPRVIHLSSSEADGKTSWLATLLRMAAGESGAARPGGEDVLGRVSELLFVEAIRCYLATLPETQTGWLAGLRDPTVGRAIAALHGEPARAWTVDSLARHVGVSRSVLAERFTALAGCAPMHYLGMWRMQIASRLLADGERVGRVAAAVGYGSEAAFSRAFKKLAGRSPVSIRSKGSA